MVTITRDEAMHLRSKGIHCPMVGKFKHAKQKSYYATSDESVLHILDEYRKSKAESIKG